MDKQSPTRTSRASTERSYEDDEISIEDTESSTSSTGHIDDDLSVELKPYLEIGKQLNVRLLSHLDYIVDQMYIILC